MDKLLQKLEDDESKITDEPLQTKFVKLNQETMSLDEHNNKEYKNFKSYKTNEIKLMIYNESKKNTEVIKFNL